MRYKIKNLSYYLVSLPTKEHEKLLVKVPSWLGRMLGCVVEAQVLGLIPTIGLVLWITRY